MTSNETGSVGSELDSQAMNNVHTTIAPARLNREMLISVLRVEVNRRGVAVSSIKKSQSLSQLHGTIVLRRGLMSRARTRKCRLSNSISVRSGCDAWKPRQ